jgi:hypothetical protein
MKTTIQVEIETTKILKKLRISKRESYEQIILRLVEMYNKEQK